MLYHTMQCPFSKWADKMGQYDKIKAKKKELVLNVVSI